MSPFGSRTSTGIPASSASSSRTTASPVLPEPVIPTTTPCVVRSLEPTTTLSAPGLPVAASITLPRWNEPRSASGPSLESSRARPASCRPGNASADRRARPVRSPRPGEGRGREAAREAQRADRRAPVPALRRGPAERPARPAGTRRLGQGRRHPPRLRRRQPDRPASSRRSASRPAPSWSTTTCGASTPHCRARGMVGVFNRSHYEDVVAVRMLEIAPEAVWRRRYEHIRAFERMLVDEGTTVVKVFLNVSREEQRATAPGAGRRPARSAGSSATTT